MSKYKKVILMHKIKEGKLYILSQKITVINENKVKNKKSLKAPEIAEKNDIFYGKTIEKRDVVI